MMNPTLLRASFFKTVAETLCSLVFYFSSAVFASSLCPFRLGLPPPRAPPVVHVPSGVQFGWWQCSAQLGDKADREGGEGGSGPLSSWAVSPVRLFSLQYDVFVAKIRLDAGLPVFVGRALALVSLCFYTDYFASTVKQIREARGKHGRQQSGRGAGGFCVYV